MSVVPIVEGVAADQSEKCFVNFAIEDVPWLAAPSELLTLPTRRMVRLDEGADRPPGWPWYEIGAPAPEEVTTEIRQRISKILGFADER